MNCTYRTVFNRSLGQCQVASELTSSRATQSSSGSANGVPRALRSIGLLTLFCLNSLAWAAPGDGGSAEFDFRGNGGASGNGGSAYFESPGDASSNGNGGNGAVASVGIAGGTGGAVGSSPGYIGGTGGNGASSAGSDAGGGGGGGGAGLFGLSGVRTLSSATGGNGGNGGNSAGAHGGGGGGGGNGASLSNGTLTNLGSISGGNGGNGGTGTIGAYAGAGGGGGHGVSGTNLNIINAGTISAGLGGLAATSYAEDGEDGAAVQFAGSTNSLTLQSGSIIDGVVWLMNNTNVTISAEDTGLALDDGVLLNSGSAVTLQTLENLGVGAVTGAGSMSKTGSATLTLTGNSTYTGSTELAWGRMLAGNSGAFSGGSAFTVGSGGTLDLNSFDQSIGSLAGAGSVSLGSANLTAGGDNTSTSFSGVISGTGSLSKAGSGTLTLTGANTYGNTTISAGTLTASVSSLGSGGVLNNASLVFHQTTDASFGNTISGSGRLTKTGTGNLALSGANTYQGGTTLNGGTLTVEHETALGTGELTVAGNATLDTSSSLELDNDITINGATELTLTGDQNLTLHGMLAGNGSLTKNGTYGLSLSGTNTFSGDLNLLGGSVTLAGDNVLTQSNLNIASGATAYIAGSNGFNGLSGEGTLTVGVGYTVSVGGDDTGSTFDGNVISGGILDKLGTGTLELNGDSLVQMGTRVSAGALVVGSTPGSIASLESDVEVASDAALAGSGNIDGTVTVADGGHLALISGSTLSVGSLVLNADSNFDAGLGAPSTTALLDVNGDLTLDGKLNVSDVGGFGLGVYRLIDYSGNLTNHGLSFGSLPSGVASGLLQLQTTVSNQVNLLYSLPTPPGPGPTPSPTVLFWNGNQTSGNGSIAGGSGTWGGRASNWTDVNGNGSHAWNDSFAVFQGSAGTVTVEGVQRTTGLQFVSDGYRLQSGAAGALILVNGAQGNASVRVDPQTTATLDVSLTGSGALGKYDSGTLVLNAANGYSGGTQLNGGTLVLGNDAALGTGRLTAANGTTLGSNRALRLTNAITLNGATTLAGSHDLILDGAISGGGSLIKQGDSTLTLDGQSSLGATQVLGGRLIVGGSAGSSARLDSDVAVSDGALLAGHGRILGDVDLASGATLAPGSSIGTLTVEGDVAFASGSTLEIEANPDGSADRLIATGAVSLGGSSLRVLAGSGSWAPSTAYSIVQAGSLSGTFGSVSSNLAFLTPELSYSAIGVDLDLVRNDISYASVAQTFNQRAVAGALDASAVGGVHDAIAVLSAEQARVAYDSLSGELHASTRGALFDDSRQVREAVSDRLRAAQYGAANGVLHSDADSGLTVWLSGYGGWSESDGNSNVADLDRDSRGTLIGLDLPLNDTWRLGLAAGYGTSDLDVSRRESSADIDSTSLTAYLGGQWDALSLRLGVARTWNEVDSKREVRAGTLRETVKASYDADTTQVFGELGYALQLGELTLEPFAGLAHVEVDSDGFAEHGGSSALSGKSEADSVDYASLGLRAAAPLGDVAGLPLKLHAGLAWQHACDDPSDESRLSLTGYDSFTVKGVPVAEDSALAQLGLGLQLAPQASLQLGYSGQFGDGSDHGVRLGLNVAF
ncbi:autotransporter domain-containing protein [Pseudomonas sp. PDM16]|uniref:autotransporter domain-containing protein n=1 Tax=Pseudomonas sp. PDM16 TaxID=2769292 RepID=UPI0017820101|nr:autotransporter domain-containing protein [Pseudomonas sp. PDM16]MBD9415562.1 autotransporter domain-containing protein [Pseudomonas sp. PDM16]